MLRQLKDHGLALLRKAGGMVRRQRRLPDGDPDGIGGYLAAGLGVLVLLIGGVGTWMVGTSLSGAVLAPGTVVVDSNIRKVQHPSGGVVGALLVRDGDIVKAGDVVVRLDETVTRASLMLLMKQLDELAVREARLRAEQDDLASVETPAPLIARQDEPQVAQILASERKLFASRRSARAGQKAQLTERISQLKEEIGGLNAQQKAKEKELELIEVELGEQAKLWSKNLTTLAKYTGIRREKARLDGDRAQLIAAAARAKGQIAEIELQVIQLDADLKAQVGRELRDIEAKQAELGERRVAAEDSLKRIDIRAPQSGVVHQLAVHTVGGVIAAGEAIMLIVPSGDELVIEARIAPKDIDQVLAGQKAFVRFSAFDRSTTPEVKGVVARVSADLARDAQTGFAYYVARIALTAEDTQRLGGLKLVPGMPAEVQIATAERTALSYLIKPLTDQIARAFKER